MLPAGEKGPIVARAFVVAGDAAKNDARVHAGAKGLWW